MTSFFVYANKYFSSIGFKNKSNASYFFDNSKIRNKEQYLSLDFCTRIVVAMLLNWGLFTLSKKVLCSYVLLNKHFSGSHIIRRQFCTNFAEIT